MGVDIRKPLKALLPHLLKAAEDNLNEADTRQRISRVLEEALGYDPMTEITRETQIRAKYVDIAVRINGSIRFLIEAKSAGTKLRDRHIDQAQHYAAEGNIPWVVLTNGVVWNLYHLTFDEGVEYTKAFSVDFREDSIDKCAEAIGVLHRRCIIKGQLEAYWEKRVALSPASIGRALFTFEALRLIRREIRRQEGILIDEEDLAASLHAMLSDEVREQVGPLKIRKGSKRRKRSRAPKEVSAKNGELSSGRSTAATSSERATATEGDDLDVQFDPVRQ